MATLKELGIIELEMRIGLDTYHPKVRVTQYDSGLTLEYDIVGRNGEVVTSLPDVVPILYVESPDKKSIGSAEGTIEGGKAIVPIPGSLLSKFGEAEAQIQLVNSETKEQIHDNTFVLDIAQSKMDGEVSPGESLWFNLQDLQEAIANVHELEQQYDTDVAAVATMRDDVTTKHSEVTTMHSSLQEVFNTESARVLAEKARADAEKLRASAETTRANNETKRVTAETGRATAETARIEAEAQRDTNEDARVANEVVRQTNEDIRVSRENTRQTNETARVTQYQQAQQLLDLLGKDPTVNLTNVVAVLKTTAHKSKYYFSSPVPGVLFKTSMSYGSMVYGLIEFNPYNNQTFHQKTKRYEFRCYIYNPSSPTLLAASLISLSGSPPIEIRIGVTDGKFWVWIPQDKQFETVYISLETNLTDYVGNRITQVIGSEKPEAGELIQDLIATPAIPKATQTYDGLYPKEHFSKVDAIPASPKYTDTVYTHPTTHPASMITQDSARRMVSDTQITTWNGKVDKTGGQMTGALVAQPSGDTRQARNIAIGTTAPTSTTGYSEGDIFLVVP